MTRVLCVALTSLVWMADADSAAGQDGDGGTGVCFVEVGASRLPHPFRPYDVAATLSGDAALVVAWNDSAAVVYEVALGAAQPFQERAHFRFPTGTRPLAVRPALVREQAGSYLRLEALAGEELLIFEGEDFIRKPVSTPWHAEAAYAAGTAWLVASLDTARTLRTARLDTPRQQSGVADATRPTTRPPSEAHGGALGLRRAADGHLVTEATYPFRIYVLDERRRVLSVVTPAFGALRRLLSEADERYIISQPAIAIGDDILQTLVALRSDARVLVRHAPEGPYYRLLPIPLAILDAVPGTNLLVATNLSAPHELILYRWRWHPTASESPCSGVNHEHGTKGVRP